MNKAAIVLFLAMAIGLATFTAGAQFAPGEFGFPNIFHHAEATAFNRDYAASSSSQNAQVSFSPWGGFPSITQTSANSYVASHTDFTHSEDTTVISFPFYGFGGSLPYGCW